MSDVSKDHDEPDNHKESTYDSTLSKPMPGLKELTKPTPGLKEVTKPIPELKEVTKPMPGLNEKVSCWQFNTKF